MVAKTAQKESSKSLSVAKVKKGLSKIRGSKKNQLKPVDKLLGQNKFTMTYNTTLLKECAEDLKIIELHGNQELIEICRVIIDKCRLDLTILINDRIKDKQ